MRRAALLLLSLVLSFGALELALRWSGTVRYREPRPSRAGGWDGMLHRPSSIPGLAYEMAPNASVEAKGFLTRTNSYGMRGPEPQASDLEGLVRLALVGDSYTLGWGVAYEATYSRKLERRLNRGAGERHRFEVLNFGVSGYSARDEALVLEHKVLRWNPRIVIVGYVLNDPVSYPREPLHAAFAPIEWWQRSHLLRLGAAGLSAWKVQTRGDGSYLRYLHNDPASWKGVVAAYETMGRLARENDISPVLVIFPTIPLRSERWSDYPFGDLHDRVAELGERNGFRVLDLLPTFARHRTATYGIHKRDRHFNEFGHRLTAQAIYEALVGWWPELGSSGE